MYYHPIPSKFQDHEYKQRRLKLKLYQNINQYYLFSGYDCTLFESHINSIVNKAANGGFKRFTTDRAPLRNKYFFGEGYTYGPKLPNNSPRMERLYPKGSVDPIPDWITNLIIKPLINAHIVPENFLNCAVINDYKPGGCIVSHIDPPHLFDRPIVSLNLFSNSALCFGCKFQFKPIRCSSPVFKLDLPRGVVTTINGFAADGITHCVRPQDVRARRAVIVLRRVHPDAPRLDDDDEESEKVEKKSGGVGIGSVGLLKLPAGVFRKFYENFSKIPRRKSVGKIFKDHNGKKRLASPSKRYNDDKPYELYL